MESWCQENVDLSQGMVKLSARVVSDSNRCGLRELPLFNGRRKYRSSSRALGRCPPLQHRLSLFCVRLDDTDEKHPSTFRSKVRAKIRRIKMHWVEFSI